MRRPRPSGRLRAAVAHRRGDGCEPVTGEEAVAIKMVEQLRADPGKQNLHGILFTAQNRSQLSAVSFAKKRFGKMSRVLLDVVAQNFSGGICCFCQNHAPAQTPFFFRSKPRLTRPAINRSKTGRIGAATCSVAASKANIPGVTPISRNPRANCAAARSSRAQSAASSSEWPRTAMTRSNAVLSCGVQLIQRERRECRTSMIR